VGMGWGVWRGPKVEEISNNQICHGHSWNVGFHKSHQRFQIKMKFAY
jgi:hypothetical protein